MKKTTYVHPKGTKFIYLVTCIKPVMSPKNELQYGSKGTQARCWGWYSDLDTAIEHVKKNVTDICEAGYYTFAVIEKVPEGILPIGVKEVKWFQWSAIKNKYLICKKPV
jgi:hypothetical protein